MSTDINPKIVTDFANELVRNKTTQFMQGGIKINGRKYYLTARLTEV